MISANRRIAVIILYLGPLPWYFTYFIHSCKFNPTVDFYIIINDYSNTAELPKNVFVIFKSFNDVNTLFAQKLKLNIQMEFEYKICDYRPAFGIIFGDIIENYAFWGYADLDVIFGNIRNFITDEIMDVYEVISMRHDYLPGCFTVYKNSIKINTLYQKSRDYKIVFEKAIHFCFDETNFHHSEFTDGIHYSKIKSEIESMTHLVRRMQEIGYLKAYFDFQIIEGRPGRLKWNDGTLVYKGKFEVLLYHLIKIKSIISPKMNKRKISNTFFISGNTIYT